jgi:hypothetical protein
MAASILKLVSLRELGLRNHVEQALLPTGIVEVDRLIKGVPRGAISEVIGEDGSGRTSLALAVLAAAARRGEVCAYIDLSGAFDPMAASMNGARLNKLIWVRCKGDLGAGLKALGEVLSAGGFGTVILDIAGASRREVRKIPDAYWHRYRLAIEHTETILILLGRELTARNCAVLQLGVTSLKRQWALRRGALCGNNLFQGLTFELALLKSAIHSSNFQNQEAPAVITARPRFV